MLIHIQRAASPLFVGALLVSLGLAAGLSACSAPSDIPGENSDNDDESPAESSTQTDDEDDQDSEKDSSMSSDEDADESTSEEDDSSSNEDSEEDSTDKSTSDDGESTSDDGESTSDDGESTDDESESTTDEDSTSESDDESDDTSEEEDLCADLKSTGTDIGDIAPDFELLDADGNNYRLHDYCESVVVIAAGAMWCPGCRAEAVRVAELQETFADRAFVGVSIVWENPSGGDISPDDLRTWQAMNKLLSPVLDDSERTWMNQFWAPEDRGGMILLAPGAVVKKQIDTFDEIISEDEVEALLPDAE